MSGYVLQVVMLHQPVIIWKDILHKRQKCTVKNVSVKCCIHVADPFHIGSFSFFEAILCSCTSELTSNLKQY